MKRKWYLVKISLNIGKEEKFVSPPAKRSNKNNLEQTLSAFIHSRQSHDDAADDAYLAFHKSTLPILKSFRVEEKMLFKIQVMELLQKINNNKSRALVFPSTSPRDYSTPNMFSSNNTQRN